MHPNSLLLSGAITCVVGARYASALEPDECLKPIQHPPLTVTEADGKYTQCYTATYTQIGPGGLHEETYTIFETCSQPVCRFPLETAPPPGFTTGAVHCETCNSGGPLTTTLTFPSASIEVYMSTVPGGPSHNATGMAGSPTTPPTTPPTTSSPLVVKAAAHIAKPSTAVGFAVSLLCLLAWEL